MRKPLHYTNQQLLVPTRNAFCHVRPGSVITAHARAVTWFEAIVTVELYSVVMIDVRLFLPSY